MHEQSKRPSPALEVGLRPFFLLAAVWAILAIGVWIAGLRGLIALSPAYPATLWHSHEMIYGFAVAGMAGFLLTAIPNWTGRPPLAGYPLAALCGLWIAGRIAVTLAAEIGLPLAAAIDLSFLAVLWVYVLREVAAAGNWRNLPVALAPGLLLASNALVHADALGAGATAALGHRIGVAVFVLLIAMIGGRIVPAFTGNWLRNTDRGEPLPATSKVVEVSSLALSAVTLVAWLVAPVDYVTGSLAALAAATHTLRLARWSGQKTGAEPLLWILHLAYAWLPVGFALLAAAALFPAQVHMSAAIHALTAGAMTTMILAMMTRAALGHTGRALHAGRGTTAVYVLITACAVSRVAAPFLATAYMPLLDAASVLWVLAFLLYLAIYAPILLGPKAAS